LPSYRQPSTKDKVETVQRWKGESKTLFLLMYSSSIFKVLKRFDDDPSGQTIVRRDLIIRNISRNDTGLYICLADNDHDTASAASYIRVQCKEDFCNFRVRFIVDALDAPEVWKQAENGIKVAFIGNVVIIVIIITIGRVL
jgi:hypothetical protein